MLLFWIPMGIIFGSVILWQIIKFIYFVINRSRARAAARAQVGNGTNNRTATRSANNGTASRPASNRPASNRPVSNRVNSTRASSGRGEPPPYTPHQNMNIIKI